MIDAGNNKAPGTPSTDLDANARIQDATQKGYLIIDLRPYEYPGVLNGGSLLMSLSSSLNPSAYSQSVNFTATVTDTAANATSPSGSVTFSEGATVLSSQPLAPVSATASGASFTTTALSSGTHSIVAINSPAAAPESSALLTQTVTGTATTTSLASSINPAPYGSVVVLTVSVSSAAPNAGAPVGTVTLMDGPAFVGTRQLAQASGAVAIANARNLRGSNYSNRSRHACFPHRATDPASYSVTRTSEGPKSAVNSL